jgi:hypothetical protein
MFWAAVEAEHVARATKGKCRELACPKIKLVMLAHSLPNNIGKICVSNQIDSTLKKKQQLK